MLRKVGVGVGGGAHGWHQPCGQDGPRTRGRYRGGGGEEFHGCKQCFLNRMNISTAVEAWGGRGTVSEQGRDGFFGYNQGKHPKEAQGRKI